MSTSPHQVVKPINGLENVPLPGFYPCLTLQLNVTMHQATRLGKFVAVLREPTDHIEVRRLFGDLEPLGVTANAARRATDLLIADMRYMMGTDRA